MNIIIVNVIAFRHAILSRCHHSFFNDFNFTPMFLACIFRTSIELCLFSTLFWPEFAANWCQAMLFIVLILMQIVSSLLTVFLFQNVLLTILSSKIYLSKNYSTSLYALTKSRHIQLTMALLFAPVHLASLFSVAQPNACWPSFDKAPFGLINVFLVLSPLLQLAAVSSLDTISGI